jgi:hypothetical protein
MITTLALSEFFVSDPTASSSSRVVAIVDVNSDMNWTWSIECLLQQRRNLIP